MLLDLCVLTIVVQVMSYTWFKSKKFRVAREYTKVGWCNSKSFIGRLIGNGLMCDLCLPIHLTWILFVLWFSIPAASASFLPEEPTRSALRNLTLLAVIFILYAEVKDAEEVPESSSDTSDNGLLTAKKVSDE